MFFFFKFENYQKKTVKQIYVVKKKKKSKKKTLAFITKMRIHYDINK